MPVSKNASARQARAALKRERPAEVADATAPEENGSSSKKMKVDHEEQVNHLFNVKSEVQQVFDMAQKKLVFKIVNGIKDSQNKCSVDAMWKRFLTLNDRETMRMGTDQSLVNSKEEMIQIIEALERDNLVMYASEDNNVILM